VDAEPFAATDVIVLQEPYIDIVLNTAQKHSVVADITVLTG
jgi:hypothetical protein